MAEAFLNQMAGDKFAAESAGLDPGGLNPIVVEAMKEVDIDISKNSVKGVFDFIKAGRSFNYIISVCDEAAGERCPIFPGLAHRISWSFPDPSQFKGTPDEKLSQVREVRDQIRLKLQEFIQTYAQSNY
jgi:arsenate reductase